MFQNRYYIVYIVSFCQKSPSEIHLNRNSRGGGGDRPPLLKLTGLPGSQTLRSYKHHFSRFNPTGVTTVVLLTIDVYLDTFFSTQILIFYDLLIKNTNNLQKHVHFSRFQTTCQQKHMELRPIRRLEAPHHNK